MYSEVKPILDTLSVPNMQASLSNLTAFHNRYYNSTTGAQASEWILNKVKNYTSDRSDILVSFYNHSWLQPSVTAKFLSSSPSSPRTIIGAHLDSINKTDPMNGRAPGADDDGTGTVNLIEAFQALVAANYRPTTPLEFHWYSAEEVGLLGSQEIATSYDEAGIDVKAMIQFDMSGYFKPGSQEVIAMESDYIDEELTDFVKSIITTYSYLPPADDIPVKTALSFLMA
ncbi:hypothetical protein VNI00_006410 [Paramarasmius palmivorus]|uniref:Peptide hydrolase n=1 Tax=Paramarasmius palmivorus TaxID=297713 RepID=A0AAW0D8S5_9AGAR